jgi:hypothetical protein
MKRFISTLLALAMLCTFSVHITVVSAAAPTFSVTVHGSNAGEHSGEGGYKEGDTVVIRAGFRGAELQHGLCFSRWTVSGEGVTLTNGHSQITTFIMPENDVTVTAHWRPTNGVSWSPVVNPLHIGTQASEWRFFFPGNHVPPVINVLAEPEMIPAGTRYLRINPDNTVDWPFGQTAGTAGHERLIVIEISSGGGGIFVTGRAWDMFGTLVTPSDANSARLMLQNSGVGQPGISTNPLFVGWGDVPIGYSQLEYNAEGFFGGGFPPANITVVGSYSPVSGAGFYQNGVVGVDAGVHPDGWVFDGWTGAGITFADANNPVTSFFTPFAPIGGSATVTANWREPDPTTLSCGCTDTCKGGHGGNQNDQGQNNNSQGGNSQR